MPEALELVNGRRRAPAKTGDVPQNIEAEAALLGAMMLSRNAIADAMTIVNAQDFHKPAHGHVFTAICNLSLRGMAVDPVTTMAEVTRTGMAGQLGDVVLSSLMANAVSTSNASSYALLVQSDSLKRSLLGVAGEIQALARSHELDGPDAVAKAETLLFAIANERTGSEVKLLSELLFETLERIEVRSESDQVAGVRSGLVDLDEHLGGLGPGTVICIAARPSMGKTQLATWLALTVAEQQDRAVLFVSAEMSEEQMGDRFIAALGPVSLKSVRSGHLLPAEWPRLTNAGQRGATLPVHVMSVAGPTLADVRAKARRLASRTRGEPPVVVVDYLQLLQGTKAENRNNEVAQLSWGLKTLAMELRTVVIVMSQLNRGVEGRTDKRPVLSDLRDSGAIEQDSDVVIGLYRDEVYHHDTADQGVAELIVLKNRQGTTGTARVVYEASTGRFMNAARGF